MGRLVGQCLGGCDPRQNFGALGFGGFEGGLQGGGERPGGDCVHDIADLAFQLGKRGLILPGRSDGLFGGGL
ncbi:hypothetical protein [Methylomagnum ishizawai]|uniref:hypothetical protein n=1 Tax=Methylomagnum ishizawai TaxID=1760988 RepID=UPI001FEA8A3B|nr:hypothetical protein [Methylomagnum ishizawai]